MLSRSFTSLSVPNYRRYFTGQLISLTGNWMQIVAEMWLILSVTGSGLAVGVTSALQFLPFLLFGAFGGLLADRVPKRNLLIVTQTLMALPRAGALGHHGERSGGAVDGLGAGLRAGLRERDRQPDPSELRDRDGRPRSGGQRREPEQRHRPLGAHPRARRRRHPDRDGGRRPVLPPERALVRSDDRRSAGHEPGRAPARARGRPRPRRGPRRRSDMSPARRPSRSRSG